MSLYSSGVLFSIMLMAALLPSVSNLAILSRSVHGGLRHGISCCVGVAVVDIGFILIAVFGMTALAYGLGEYLSHIIILAAAYLIYLGLKLYGSHETPQESDINKISSLWTSFLTGVAITIADQKAIFFYFGFLPAFIDVSRISWLDIGIIIIIALIAISSKMVYGLFAGRCRNFLKSKNVHYLNKLSGTALIFIALYIIYKYSL